MFRKTDGALEKHDILVLRTLHCSETPNHIAIATGPEHFIHMTASAGVSAQRLSRWKKYVVGTYRHKDLAH